MLWIIGLVCTLAGTTPHVSASRKQAFPLFPTVFLPSCVRLGRRPGQTPLRTCPVGRTTPSPKYPEVSRQLGANCTGHSPIPALCQCPPCANVWFSHFPRGLSSLSKYLPSACSLQSSQTCQQAKHLNIHAQVSLPS